MRVSPKVKSRCDGLAGHADVQAGELILWMAVRITFVKVTVPPYQNTNGASLNNRAFNTF